MEIGKIIPEPETTCNYNRILLWTITLVSQLKLCLPTITLSSEQNLEFIMDIFHSGLVIFNRKAETTFHSIFWKYQQSQFI